MESSQNAHIAPQWPRDFPDGRFSSDWFLGPNWDAGIPRRTFDVNINTVTPNPTVISSLSAEANNLAVGQNGTGMLTIQNGGR
jgi:hypothetical protein